MRPLIGIAGAVICSCAPCYDSAEPNYTSYSVHATERSSLGFGIDDPLHELDRVRLDKIIGDVRNCIAGLGQLTPSEVQQGECLTDQPTAEIRPCLTIKTAPDWHWSPDGGQQLFGTAPAASCEAKGLTPTPDNPCEFRAIIQDNCTVVTAPNMVVLAGQLATLMTTCNNSWIGRVDQCAAISTKE